MKHSIKMLVAAVLWSLLCSSAHAQPSTWTSYQLQPASQFSEGCLDPCDCPIWMAEGVRGSFCLSPAGMDGTFHVFDVLNVALEFDRGTDTIAIVGSGTYLMDPDALLQVLELDLEIGQDPMEHFDSGLVPVVEQAPKLQVAVAMNGFYCYDRVVEISAAPAPVITTHGVSWGAVKARYDD